MEGVDLIFMPMEFNQLKQPFFYVSSSPPIWQIFFTVHNIIYSLLPPGQVIIPWSFNFAEKWALNKSRLI